jgi:hypothetical protein
MKRKDWLYGTTAAGQLQRCSKMQRGKTGRGDGELQQAVREGVMAGLSTRNRRWTADSVREGYVIERSR